MLSLANKASQVLPIGVGVFAEEGLQHRVGPGDQAVAPAFQVVEALVVLARRGVKLVQQLQDGVSVLIAHQLADELNVPFARDVRRVLGRIGQGLAQRIGERQLVERVGFEGRQALAQIHQRMQLALDLSFAFSLVEGVVVRINHGGSPKIIAAMITSRGPLVRPGRRLTRAEHRI